MTPETRSDALPGLAEEFWAWRAASQPFTMDDISRLERPCGKRDWSAESVAQHRNQLAAFETRWRQIDPNLWSVPDQVDHRLIGSALARVRWEMDVLRRWQRDPTFYVEQTLTALQEALTVPGPYNATQSREILTRIENIPSILESAKSNLHQPPAPFAALAASKLDGIRDRLKAMAMSLQPETTIPAADLNAAVDRAATALEQYRAWLQEIEPALPPQTAIGRDGYVFFLQNVALMPFTPEDLLAMGRQELQRAVAFEQIERERNVGVPPLEIAPDLPTQVARAVDAENAIRKFVEEKNLLTVPRSMAHYTVGPTPSYLKALDAFGEMIHFTSASRQRENAVRYLDPPSPSLGYFWLATAKDPRPDMVHEGVPGHYHQFVMSWNHPNPIRRHFYDSGANEGIAFYAEEMMLQAGLFDDSRHSREIIYNFARLRALRVEVDVKLALGLFTIDEAAAYLERTVPMDSATAQHEAAFFASGPGQAITYQIGKLQVLEFLADARRHQGDRFRLREFHDYLWLNGNVPIALLRWEMLGLRDQIDRIDADANTSSTDSLRAQVNAMDKLNDKPKTDTNDASRRSFLRGMAALPLVSMLAGKDLLTDPRPVPSPLQTPASGIAGKKKFVAIQIGARSFVDEGVDKVLDDLQQKGGVNVLMPAVFTYGRGLAGRQTPGQPLPDHGAQQYDEIRGGSYARLHPEFEAKSVINSVRAPDLGDFDILADVIPKAKARGMQTYCLFEEAYNPRVMPGFEKIAEVDLNGKAGGSTCLNNPDARNFLVALVEDWFKHNDLDGMMWESERQGPLNNTLGAHFGRFNGNSSIYCFCRYCIAKGTTQGINVERARAGYAALDRWVKETLKADRRAGSGAFVSLWRLVLEYPEVIAWQKFWFRSQEEVYGLLRQSIKAIHPRAQVGWHIMHLVTMSPFYQAEQDYARLATVADFIKPCAYNNCAGPRFAQYIRNVQSTIFRDFTPDEVLALHYRLLGYEHEAPLDKLPTSGMSAEYVVRETRRALADVNGAVPIYPGIDIDIPTGLNEKRTQPSDVKAAVLAAFKAGAPGVVLSRKYAEMRLTNVAGAGDALRELG